MKRWYFGVESLVGDGWLQLGLGVRVTLADAAIAVFVHLLTFEVMVQYNRGSSDDLPSGA